MAFHFIVRFFQKISADNQAFSLKINLLFSVIFQFELHLAAKTTSLHFWN